MKTNFYSWMKARTEKVPTSDLDKKILSHSSQFFAGRSERRKTVIFNWKISSIAALASIALLIVLLNKSSTPQPSAMMISESPEMILNYNDIELMADASTLSEAEWAKINGTK